MMAEEETELRDLIIQNLENCGFLNKIKAELRAGVCLALEEDSNLKTKIPLCNKTFDDFINTSDGKLIISIVREFLEYFGLNFTLSVFDPEVSCKTPCFTRPELCDQLKLNIAKKEPIISGLLKINQLENETKKNLSIDNESVEFNSSLKESELQLPVTNEDMRKSETDKTSTILKEVATNSDNLRNVRESTIFEKNNEYIGEKKSTEDVTAKEKLKDKGIFSKVESSKFEKRTTNFDDIFGKEKSSSNFGESKGISPDHDPFFDEPVPSINSPYFNYSENNTNINLQDKLKSNIFSEERSDQSTGKNTLTSLKNLPSLAPKEWAFGRDTKNTLPSLDSLKSISSSENSNEEIINLDERDMNKKDIDCTESNEDISDKQGNSESIEEEIEEDSSAGDYQDLLNNSLSLGDDVTTDQTTSQISIVEGVDHVEPCNSVD